jgi:hypothetical protein
VPAARRACVQPTGEDHRAGGIGSRPKVAAQDKQALELAQNILRVPGVGGHPKIKALAQHTIRLVHVRYPHLKL